MKKYLLVFLCSSFLILKAQQPVKKEHYRILNPSSGFTLNYDKALSHADLDSLRFLNERRQIPIEGTKIIIELYSAKELLTAYGKQISPLTITNPLTARKVKFKLPENNYNIIVIPN